MLLLLLTRTKILKCNNMKQKLKCEKYESKCSISMYLSWQQRYEGKGRVMKRKRVGERVVE